MVRIIPRDQIKHLEWDQKTQPISTPPTPNSAPRAPSRSKIAHSIGDLSIDSLVKNGKPFYNSNIPIAFTEAQNYAGSGVVATMPYLIAGKAESTKKNYLWKDWYTANTEEDIGIDTDGIHVSKGKPVLITLHGGGILTPERITKAYADGLTPQNAAVLDQEEIDNLLREGILPSGDKITVYSIEDLQKGISDPFGRYAVISDFEKVKTIESRQFKKKEFMENPLILVRAGTMEHLDSYFNKAKDSDGVGCWHRFGEIDQTVPQGRLLYLYNNYNGLNGYDNLYNIGRFVGVAPEAHGAKK